MLILAYLSFGLFFIALFLGLSRHEWKQRSLETSYQNAHLAQVNRTLQVELTKEHSRVCVLEREVTDLRVQIRLMSER